MNLLMYVWIIIFVGFLIMLNGLLQVSLEDSLIATTCKVFGVVTIDGTTFTCEVKE